jgi:hypothetical protein
VTTPETNDTTQPATAPPGGWLARWLRQPSAITWLGGTAVAVVVGLSAFAYRPGSILEDYDLQAAILAVTAVSLFVTAQFTRAATNESRTQFDAQHQERERGHIETRGRLSLMLAVECAEINHICEEAYRTVLAAPRTTPHRTWDIPTPVFNSVTAQIGALNQAAEIVALYSGVSAATRLGTAWSGMNPVDVVFGSFRHGYFGNLGSVLDQTAALLPLLKATARDAHISTDKVLEARSSVQVDQAVRMETGKPVVHPA